MPIEPFLAMTAAEIRNSGTLPGKIAWMACHFSPYGLGLSNLPPALPPDSLLMVDDITPPHGHDPERVAAQLWEYAEALQCSGILLDFQRPRNPETTALVQALTAALPCPVGVSGLYAGDVDCPVFLPPIPLSVPMKDYIAPWAGREIWLELALDGEIIVLTEQGAKITPLPFGCSDMDGFTEETLHCHYKMEPDEDSVKFTLWRTVEDLYALLEESANMGITMAVGLYQELHTE